MSETIDAPMRPPVNLQPPCAATSLTESPQTLRRKSGTWLPAEDDRLRVAIAKHGTRWVAVAGEVGTRNGDQCAKRWNAKLNPELDHSPWSPEEVSRNMAALSPQILAYHTPLRAKLLLSVSATTNPEALPSFWCNLAIAF